MFGRLDTLNGYNSGFIKNACHGIHFYFKPEFDYDMALFYVFW